jgi:transposase
VLADLGYDADWIRAFPAKCGRVWANIPLTCIEMSWSTSASWSSNFSTKSINEIKECALISQRALTDLVPARLDNVGALAH